MNVASKATHVVQVSYDESVFVNGAGSDTLKRQIKYGKLLHMERPGSLMSFLVLTTKPGFSSFRSGNVFFQPVQLRRSTTIITDLLNHLNQLDKNLPIDSIAPQSILEDGMAALHFKRRMAAKGRQVRVVGQIHFDLFSPRALGENFGQGQAGLSKFQRIVDSLRDYDALRVVGSGVRDRILTDGLHEVVELIPVPATLLADERLSAPARRERLVLFVGRLEAAKRMDVWLRVAGTLAKSDPEVRFEVVGEGSLRESLVAMTADMGLSERVRFHGAIPYDQLASFYSRAKVFMLTSSNEGFGRVLVEAYAQGVPVVASRVGGIGDIVLDGHTGYLEEFGDIAAMSGRVENLLNDDHLRDAMAEKGLQHVREQFHPEVLAKRWASLMLPPAPVVTAVKPAHGILPPRRATYSRYKRLKSMDYSLLRAMEYERLEGVELRGRTLDVGGGEHNSYYHLFRVEGSIESVNISPDIRPTHLADLNKPLPFPEESYDNIISLNTFEHIYEDRMAISEAIRVLKPQGSFHFMVPFLYRVHGSPCDYHRHTATWWQDFLVGLGIASEDFTVEPMVWDEASSAAALIHWQNNPSFRRWLMLDAVVKQRRLKGEYAQNGAEEFALGYYIHGKKTVKASPAGEGEVLSQVPRQRYFPDADQRTRYESVKKWLGNSGVAGNILDIGSRGRIAKEYIHSEEAHFLSANMGKGYDFKLKEKLSFSDGQFNAVICLDGLECVENIHETFKELARVSSGNLIVALPNMAVYSKRLNFLNSGHLVTGKYDLTPRLQEDRCRWFPTYSQSNLFIEAMSRECGYQVALVMEEMEDWSAFTSSPSINDLDNGLYCDRCIYFLNRI